MKAGNQNNIHHKRDTGNLRRFEIRVVREAGTDGHGGPFLPYAEETFTLEAGSRQEAYLKSMLTGTVKFMGQLRRTFIDGTEHYDERY